MRVLANRSDGLRSVLALAAPANGLAVGDGDWLLAFLDLRFSNGHVERWLGPGRAGTRPAEPGGLAALQRWAADTANEFAFDIACDVARDYEIIRPPAVDDLNCEEVVVEWHQALPAWVAR